MPMLGPISLVDCAVFVVCLLPQLFIQAGIYDVLLVVVKVLPFLLFQLPYQLIYERYRLPETEQSPFCQNATLFQDIVIRCVRYAFAFIPASIGRVFFSKAVAHPFFRWRLLRHGYLYSPVKYTEVKRHGFTGLWVATEPEKEPDVIIFYCHGGGFSMGSSYFYLEFLIAWLTCLKDRGYKNPACFALEYTLVPDATWPTQFEQTRDAYKFLCSSFGEGSAKKIVVSGDSAGATLVLSLLLQPGALGADSRFEKDERPALAVLLSPWTHMVSELNRNTPSDYLNRDSLHLYASQYAGKLCRTDGIVSPGLSVGRWKNASPTDGLRVIYGAEEVFAPGISEMVKGMEKDGAFVTKHAEPAGIHAWPVVNLFLGGSRDERLKGLVRMTDYVAKSPSLRQDK
ncbi:hypothetical protein PMZ80_002778 [Knufia obscura]|uniref:Alpha/beta hydrolase fold-3 domain-containing protein n=1 Tax=Knufia obscura TaxID=1635080 RepID=A0ABR0RZC9_9EURO|nr:hypothetical protein PMZ80_002778 [Knufia obscura]